MFKVFCLNLHDPHFFVELHKLGAVLAAAIDPSAVVIDLCFVELSDSISNFPLEFVDDFAPLDLSKPGLVSFEPFLLFELCKIFGDGLDAYAGECLK